MVTSEGAPRAATAIAVAAWSLAAVATLVLVAARPPLADGLLYFLVDVVVAGVYGTVAGMVLSRRRHPVPWILAVTAVGGGLAALGYACRELTRDVGDLPVLAALAWLNSTAWVPGTLALFLVVPWLVRDHPLGPARWGLAAGVLTCAAFTASSMTASVVAFVGSAVAAVLVGLVTAAAVGLRWRRGPVAERVGLGWLAVGTAVMALSFVPIALLDVVQLPFWTTPTLHLLAQAFFPAAILVAVLRQRMWGLDLGISRATLAGLMTAVLLALYVVVTAVVTRALPGGGAAQVVAAAAVAVAVQPSRLWLQRRVERLVHGDAADPRHALARLGRHLGRAGTARELLDGLVESVAGALRLESAALVVSGDTVARHGSPSGTPEVVPLQHRGEHVGHLAVTAPPGELLDARSRAALAELGSVVGAGVALTLASADLEAARDRLTSARLEERKVLRRELHDGLGPALAGIRLGLQAARNLVTTDPRAAGEVMTALQEELDARVDDVRTLSRSLLPPVLDDVGLHGALDELAGRWREEGVEVRVEVDVPAGLSSTLAAAAYGIASEAVTNVARHSGARACTVRVRTERVPGVGRTELLVQVDDAGAGVAPGTPSGVGSHTMRERAEEQGGTWRRVALEPRGTRVEARLPVAGDRSEAVR